MLCTQYTDMEILKYIFTLKICIYWLMTTLVPFMTGISSKKKLLMRTFLAGIEVSAFMKSKLMVIICVKTNLVPLIDDNFIRIWKCLWSFFKGSHSIYIYLFIRFWYCFLYGWAINWSLIDFHAHFGSTILLSCKSLAVSFRWSSIYTESHSSLLCHAKIVDDLICVILRLKRMIL